MEAIATGMVEVSALAWSCASKSHLSCWPIITLTNTPSGCSAAIYAKVCASLITAVTRKHSL